jgi:predicted metal-dependent peptidase
MALVTTYHNALLRAMSSDVAPYFRSYLLLLRPVETDKVPTAAVDAQCRVYWNREFFASLNINEGAFVVLHEMFHPFLRHAERGKRHGVTDFKLWNIATDCEINRTLAQMQGVVVPSGLCLPEKFGLPTNERAEVYYDLLRIKQEDEGDDDGDGGGGGTPIDVHGSGAGDSPGDWELPVDDPDAPGASGVDQKMAEEQSGRDICEADRKQSGRIPGTLVRHAEAINAPPKVPWQRLLKAAVNHGVNAVTGYDEPTYRRVAARSFSLGGDVLLPTYESHQPTVSVIIDTSGSMSQADLSTALRETQGVCKALDCTVTVFAADTRIGAAQSVTKASDIKLSGGGGTDMSAAIVQVAAIKPVPNIIVVLTDGYTDWPAGNPNPRIKYITVITEGGMSTTDGIPAWITAIKVSK